MPDGENFQGIYDGGKKVLFWGKGGKQLDRAKNPIGSYHVRPMGNQEVAEFDSSGTLLRQYVFGPGVDEPIVTFNGSGTKQSGSVRRRYKHNLRMMSASHIFSAYAFAHEQWMMQTASGQLVAADGDRAGQRLAVRRQDT
jgi:hypothetical protein